jgi:hypothetical protein
MSIQHEIKGSGVLSRVGVAHPSQLTPANAAGIARRFQHEVGRDYALARLVLFSSVDAGARFEVGKGNFHPDLQSWQTAQERESRSCPAVEVIVLKQTLAARVCEASGRVKKLVLSGEDVFNWKLVKDQPELAFLSIWPGMYTKAEGSAPDDGIRVRLYFVARRLPKTALAEKLVQKYGGLIGRPVTASIQVRGTFVSDPFYPYANPFLTSLHTTRTLTAGEPIASCRFAPEPRCVIVPEL